MSKKFIPMLALALLLSCVDIVHYVETTGDKKARIEFRLSTIMDNKDGGGKNFSKEEVMKDLGIKPGGSGLSYKDHMNEYEKGFTLSLEVPVSSLKMPAKGVNIPLVPYRDGKGQYIFLFREGISKSKDDRLGSALLMTAKYRIVLAGEFRPKKALLLLAGKEPIRHSPLLYRLGRHYCMDIPLGLVFDSDAAVIVSPRDEISDGEMVSLLRGRAKQREEREEKERLENGRRAKPQKEEPEKKGRVNEGEGAAEN